MKLESVPPDTLTSLNAKFVEISLSVNVTSANCDPLRFLELLEIETVGGVTSKI